jgi:hypothetical protein
VAQHDYSIANGTGSAVRSDLNNALAAIVSMNSGSTEPATTFAFQFWADTNANLLKMRNSANNGWIELRQLDGEFTNVSVANGTAAAPSIFFNASGTDTGIYSNGTDSVDVSTGGTRRLDIGSAGDVTVRGGNVTLNAQGDLRLADSNSSNWVAFQAPATVTSNVTWTLPSADGSNGQALTTNGSGTLSWTSAGGASITTGNTTAEVVDTGSDGHFKVTTEGTEALRVNASQDVGIGTASAALRLHVEDSNSQIIRFARTGVGAGTLDVDANGNAVLNAHTSSTGIAFHLQTNEAARIDSSGRLLLGTSTALANIKRYATSAAPPQQISTAVNSWSSGLSLINYSGSSYAPVLTLGLSRSNTQGTNALVTSGSRMGVISFNGNDGTDFEEGGRIEVQADGTPSSTSMPGRLMFFTTSAGSVNPTEQMRLDSSGNLKFNSGYGSVATAYGVRTWATANCSTDTITASGNVSSLTEINSGEHRFNFTSSITSNYACVATAGGISGATGDDSNASLTSSQQLTTSTRVRTAQNNVLMLNMIIVR